MPFDTHKTLLKKGACKGVAIFYLHLSCCESVFFGFEIVVEDDDRLHTWVFDPNYFGGLYVLNCEL